MDFALIFNSHFSSSFRNLNTASPDAASDVTLEQMEHLLDVEEKAKTGIFEGMTDLQVLYIVWDFGW